MKVPKATIYGIDIVKNFIFFAFFVLITIIIVSFTISPAIRDFKQTKKEYYETKNKLEVTANKYKEKIKKLKKIKNINKKILNAFKRDLNKETFSLFASNYMEIYSVKKTNFTKFQKDFIKTTYIVESTIKTPKNFYDFIDAIKNNKYILRVYFPNRFVKNNEEINLILKIEHYRLIP